MVATYLIAERCAYFIRCATKDHMGDISSVYEVVEATPQDISCILSWLEQEYEEDGDGFWCNHNLISDAGERPEELWVIRKNQKALAFQLGRYSADIVSVRKDHRKMGMAKALVEASKVRAFRDDVNALMVHCMPESSLNFWLRMGFLQYEDPDYPEQIKAHLILDRTFSLPADLPTIDVAISFYPEEALYGAREHVSPVATYQLKGAYSADGSVTLDRRAIGFTHIGGCGRDTAIKIEVAGEQLCFCKGKRNEAAAFGVQRDDDGGTFFIDKIKVG